MKLEMDFISSESFVDKTPKERVNLILKRVKKNKIVVIEGILDPQLEMYLIENTMKSVNDGFTGIEVCSLRKKTKLPWKIMERIMNSLPTDVIEGFVRFLTGKSIKLNKSGLKRGLTLIGPSKIIKKIKKNKKSFSVLAEV